tara:strand:- start:58 stop:705 length:648 start_codon:yes stop_codon:yes gene_type:complete
MKKSYKLYYAIVGVAAILGIVFIADKIKNKSKSKGKGFRKNLAKIAEKEYADWNFGNTKETSISMYQRLADYWKSVGWGTSSWTPSSVPWSAAFISFVLKKSGAGNDFKSSSSHSKYIRDAVINRKSNNSNPFKAYKINEKKVEVGDLVCYARQSGVGYDTTSSYKSHCDIVVSADNNEAQVIGGNVGHSVTKTKVNLKNGYVNDSKWFTIIKTT